MKLLSLLFLFVLLASSCSQKSETSNAKMEFVLGASVGSGTVGGMLWGKNNSKNLSFGQSITPGVAFEKELEHGDWTFWVITWSGNDFQDRLTGITKCDSKTVSINATTPNVDVSFSLANSKCNLGFGPTDSITTQNNTILYFFPNLSFNNCKTLSSSSSASDLCNVTSGNQGYFASYKVSFPNFENNQLSNELGLTSTCFGPNNLTNLNIPAGSFLTHVRAYYGSNDCGISNSPSAGLALGFKDFVLPQGLAEATAQTKPQNSNSYSCIVDRVPMPELQSTCQHSTYFYCPATGHIMANFCPAGPSEMITSVVKPNAHRLKLVLTSNSNDVCQGIRMNSTFAGGNGTENNPYILCTANQFNNIQNNYLSSHFRLARDIDMNLATNVHCPQNGNNTNPIGNLFDSNCDGVPTAPSYTGHFTGDNHMISNIRMNSDLDQVGLIRKINLTGKISKLILNNARISGKHSVGAFIGDSLDNQNEHSDLQLRNSKIETYHGGGIVGFLQGPNGLANVKVVASEIKDRGFDSGSGTSYIGGIAGDLEAHIREASFDGVIVSNRNGPFLGGIAGKVKSSQLSRTVSHGLIRISNGTAGGIAGSSDGIEILDSYSTMSLALEGSSATLGGIVGEDTYSSTATSITNVFFFGSASTTCSSCSIGAIVGSYTSIIPNITNTFSFQNYLLGNAINGSVKTYDELRSSTELRDNIAEFWQATWNSSSDPIWTHTEGDFPRLIFETPNLCQHPMNLLPISNQIALTRGTVNNPIVICSRGQLSSLSTAVTTAGRHFILGDSITGDSNTSWVTNASNAFNSILDGKNKIIHSILSMNNSSASYEKTGFVKTLNGTIKNIIFANIEFEKSTPAPYSETGIVAGRSHGTIENVKVLASKLKDQNSVGLIAGVASGYIKNVEVSGKVEGLYSVGGVVGSTLQSESQPLSISRAISSVDLSFPYSEVPIDNYVFGGIIGRLSFGKIDQAKYTGIIDFMYGQTTQGGEIGGIVGHATSAEISNTLFSEHSEIRINSASQFFGGLVGTTGGATTIKDSISLGNIFYDMEQVGTCDNPSFPTKQMCNMNLGKWVHGIDHGEGGFCSDPTIMNEALCSGAKSWYWKPQFDNRFIGIGSSSELEENNLFGDSYPYYKVDDISIDSCTPSGNHYLLAISSPHIAPIFSSIPKVHFAIRTATSNRIFHAKDIITAFSLEVEMDTCETGMAELLYAFNEGDPSNERHSYSKLTDLNFYCPSIAGSTDQNFKCTNGLDIIPDFGPGTPGRKRIYDTYLSEQMGAQRPAYAPIWVMENSPKLYFAW